MKSLLVAIDFSEVTDRVVEQAARLAQAFSSRVRLVHIAEPDPDFVGYEAGPESVRGQVASELRDEHRKVQELADGLRGHGIDVMALSIQGATVEKILEEAHRADADLIVMGSHGRGGLSRVVMGSVSEGVLRKAACPVLIVPARRA
jgi:nucleotide-binding universal stress UspA family protein